VRWKFPENFAELSETLERSEVLGFKISRSRPGVSAIRDPTIRRLSWKKVPRFPGCRDDILEKIFIIFIIRQR